MSHNLDKINFSCAFEVHLEVSLGSGFRSSLIHLETSLEGESSLLPVSMGLFSDDSFTQQITGSPTYSVPDIIHIGIFADSQTQFNLVLQNCWATPRYESY